MSIIDGLQGLSLSIARNPVTAVGLPLAIGTLSGLPTRKAVRGYWYNSLASPPGRPPSKTFPVAWSLLYIGMGYASHLAAKEIDSSFSSSTRDDASLGLALYYGQLGLNFLWTPLFFKLKKPGLALVDITALTGIVAYLTKTLHGPTGGKSTYFLAPYCAWLGFATYLNGGMWWLNRNKDIVKKD
ncbi:TspO/MBR-related protein [Phellopilus nigrolimitatus]|nr:TspO/MBR-related protein [Phellopilus nigrolimitatus]